MSGTNSMGGQNTYTQFMAPSVAAQNVQRGTMPSSMGMTFGNPNATGYYRPSYGGYSNPYSNPYASLYSNARSMMGSYGQQQPNYFNNMAYQMAGLPSYNIPRTGSYYSQPAPSPYRNPGMMNPSQTPGNSYLSQMGIPYLNQWRYQ